MALIPIKVSSHSENKKYADPEISPAVERAKAACFSKAARNYLKQKGYRNKYLADEEDFEYSDDLWESFKSYLYSPPLYTDADAITGINFYDKVLNAVFVGIDGYEEGDILNATFKISSEVFRNFLGEQGIITVKEPDPPPVEKPATTSEIVYTVVISKSGMLLGLRDTPGQIGLEAGDLFSPDGKSNLADVPVGPGGVGALRGRLPIGTKVKVLQIGNGAGGAWSQVEVLDSSDATQNGKIGFVDAFYIKQLTSSGQEKLKQPSNIASLPSPGAVLEVEDMVTEQPPIHIDGEEYNSLSSYVSSMEPTQLWRNRPALFPFKNDKEKRFEMMVELDYFPEVAQESEGGEGIQSYQDGKLQEARTVAIRSLLQYYNKKSDDDYVFELIMKYQNGPYDNHLVEELEFYSDDNPENQKVQYWMAIPYRFFDPRVHPQAVDLPIKELIKAGMVKHQMVFNVKEIEERITKLKTILHRTIEPGMDNYNGTIENAPDIEFQTTMLDGFISAMREHLFENGVKWRDDEEVWWTDLVELGLDSDLKVVYIKFGPQDGETGQWKLGDE